MVSSMAISVARIYRYPVKGLSGESLDRIEVEAGRGLPGDRRFALALASTRFDPDRPEWLPKTSFLMLMRDQRLGALETRFDGETGILSVFRGGREVVRADITSPLGRSLIEDFFAAYMQAESAGRPKLVAAPSGHMFSDHQSAVLSIINLASLTDIERVVRRPIDPLRFRANLYLEGAPPWAESAWVDEEIRIGDVRMAVSARIERCAAINVEPGTGARNMNLPKALRAGFGHVHCGVYARVLNAGTIAVGDSLTPPPARQAQTG